MSRSKLSLKDGYELLKKVKIIPHKYDIPYLAGYSNDGKKLYIDRRVPEKFKGVSIYEFLALHEVTEKYAEDNFNMEHEDAHYDIATPIERQAVENAGLKWKEYTGFISAYVRTTEHETVTNVPGDLDMQPYHDEHDCVELRKIEKMQKADTLFKTYSPQHLRDAIDIEMKKNSDPAAAARIAITRLKKNPHYYMEEYGLIDTEFNILEKNMQKATGSPRANHKYYKRIPNPKGKGWLYFYTKEEWKQYSGTKAFNIFDTLKSLFGFSDKKQAQDKIKEDYKANDIHEKFNITLSSWIDHVTEYFQNKDKWSKFFNREKGDTGKKDKKESKAKDKKDKKKSSGNIKISVMKMVHELYGNIKKQEKPKGTHRVFIIHKDDTPATDFENLTEAEAKAIYAKYKKDPNSEITTWEDNGQTVNMHTAKNNSEMRPSKDNFETMPDINTLISDAHTQWEQKEAIQIEKEYDWGKKVDQDRIARGLKPENFPRREIVLPKQFALSKAVMYIKQAWGDIVGKSDAEIKRNIKNANKENTVKTVDRKTFNVSYHNTTSAPAGWGEQGLRPIGYDLYSREDIDKWVASKKIEKIQNEKQLNNFETMPESEAVKNAPSVPDTPEQKEEVKQDEELVAREGYFNEKPSEILNVGKDVWGAARHNFDTYEKFNVDLNQMELDGTASAYVSKKNIFGSYGLADKDERVAKGETEYKVLASFAIREYLAKMPGNNEESRKKYMEFCRAITRLDQESTDAKTFYVGLGEVFASLFNIDLLDEKKKFGGQGVALTDINIKDEKKKIIDIVGPHIYLLLMGVNGIPDRSVLWSLNKTEQKQFKTLSDIVVHENKKPDDPYRKLTYNELYADMFGAMKAAGIKLKKGDEIKFTEKLKDKCYLKQSTIIDPEKRKKTSLQIDDLLSTAISEIRPKEGETYYSIRKMTDSKTMKPVEFKSEIVIKSVDRRSDDQSGYIHYSEKNQTDRYGSEMSGMRSFIQNLLRGKTIPLSVDPLLKKRYDEYKTEFQKLQNEYESCFDRKQFFPVGNGQVIKAGKDKVQVAFKFEDGATRIFELKPSDIEAESIENITRTSKTKSGQKLNLYMEKVVQRKGGKNYDSMTVEQQQEVLQNQYQFKALQYGNSMPVDERKYHTKWTLQSFSDLSEILNLPIQQVTVNGKLGMAFGARGKGGGGRDTMTAVAHYEPNTKMINLTRSNGFGSLAHEWGHFFDNILSEGMSGWITAQPKYEEKHVTKDTIKHGSIFEGSGRRGKVTRYFYDANSPDKRYPFVRLESGQTAPGNNPTRVGIYALDRGIKVKEPVNVPFMDTARNIAQRSVASLQKQCQDKIDSIKGDSDDEKLLRMFLKEDIMGSGYYNSPQEAFARAFESYVADKLEDNGRLNTYLSSKRKTTGDDGKLIYPQGEFRKEINGLFDEFFTMLRGSEDLKKAIKFANKTVVLKKKLTYR